MSATLLEERSPIPGFAGISRESLIEDIDRELGELDVRETSIRDELLDDPEGSAPIEVPLNPTQWAFVHCDANICLLRGARRDGKTTAGVVRLLRIAEQVGATNPGALPLRVACVRDTWTNLQRTVLETIRKGHRAGWWHAQFSEQDTECVLNFGAVHLYFFGMDTVPDANKFQSFEIAVLWIEEPAPAADFASGVPVEVFALGVTSLSQQGVPTSVQITSNPSDETHWTVVLLERLAEMGRADLTVRIFKVPAGENVRNQPKGYRDRMRTILMEAGRADLVQRLVDGEIGTVTLGIAVTPNFIEAQHVSGSPVDINPRWPAYRSWDFGGSPACTLAQRTPSSHLYVIGALETPENTVLGVKEFIERILLPFMSEYRIRTRPSSDSERTKAYYRFRDMGDSAGSSREGSSSERSAVRVLEAMLRTSFEPAPIEWAPRRESMAYVLNQMVGSTRMLQIDPDTGQPLVNALRGRWHYHKTSAGVVSDRPVKDHASHIGDSFGYMCAVLHPVAETIEAIARGTDVAPARPTLSAVNVPWWAR